MRGARSTVSRAADDEGIDGDDFPPIRFTVEDFVLDDEVNLLYGKGGVGKSVTSTQMGVSVAAGKPFFGRKTIQRPVILVLSEDQYPKTKERIVAHCKAIDVNPIDLPLQPWCLRGEDLSMAKITDEGAVTLLPFYKALEAKMAATPGAFVVLDGLADVGQMSEKDRVPVTAFMKKVLGKLSVKYSATILVLGHPSKAAEADGSWHSGSTAFVNAVRNMLVMKHVPDSPLFRTLEVHKANYSGPVTMTVRFSNPIFHALESDDVQKNELAKADLIRSVIFELIEAGANVTKSNQSQGHTPKDVAKLVNKRGLITVNHREVLDVMKAAELSTLTYIPGRSKTAAHFELKKPGEDFVDTPADALMHPVSEIAVPTAKTKAPKKKNPLPENYDPCA